MKPDRAIVRAEGVYKVFPGPGGPGEPGSVLALRDIYLGVRSGEFLTMVGPSGCGKSTLLNIVAGLVRPTAGRILYKDREVLTVNTDVGYITQDDNLLPWRSLLENVELGLEFRGVVPGVRRERAQEFIARVGLTGFEHHYPHQLSGGMRKRAAIARTLVCDPEVILMDEPFGPLDAQTRVILQDELLRLWEGSGKTILFVTHDLVECIALADQIVVFSAAPGSIVETYPVPIPRPRDVFHIHAAPGFAELHGALWDDLRKREPV